MPPRGLHGPSKPKKAAHGRAMSKPKPAEPVYDLDYLATEMHQVVTLLDKLIKIIERMAPQQQRGALPEPSEFVSGGFHRRSGDIYQSVAEPGTPNAGMDPAKLYETIADAVGENPNADDPSGPVRSTKQR